MRLLLAGTLATLTAAGLAAIRPALCRTRSGRRPPPSARTGSAPTSASSRATCSRDAAPRHAAIASPASTSPRASRRSGSSPAPPEGAGSSLRPRRCDRRLSRGAARLERRAGADLRFHEDYVAFSGAQAPEARVDDAEIVFVGYGIVAPEYGWDDYKGADLKGKVLLLMNNDPESDPQLFAGKRRLYYGRWDYKYEMAARLGAAGAHHHPHRRLGRLRVAGGADLVDRRAAHPARAPGEPDPPGEGLADRGRVPPRRPPRRPRPRGAARRGREARLPAGAARRQAEPGARERGLTPAERQRDRPAARAAIPCSRGEAVVYTAHHDHLGTKPAATGRDASCTTARSTTPPASPRLLAVAEAFAALPERPRRSILFATVAAEEQGLLGSRYLARHPPVPPGRLAANINIDGVNIWGRTRDVPVIGLGKSSLDDWIRALAEAQGRVVVPEAFPDKGSYYRSDHFSFARDRGALGLPRRRHRGARQAARAGAARGSEAWEDAHYHQPIGRPHAPSGTSPARSRTRSCSSYLGREGGGRARSCRRGARATSSRRRARRPSRRSARSRPAARPLARGAVLPAARRPRRDRPPPGEALVRVRVAGVCNTDLELVRGYYPYTGVPGHEFVGGSRRRPAPPSGSADAWWARSTRPAAPARPAARAGAATARGARCSASSRANGAFAKHLLLPVANLHAVPDARDRRGGGLHRAPRRRPRGPGAGRVAARRPRGRDRRRQARAPRRAVPGRDRLPAAGGRTQPRRSPARRPGHSDRDRGRVGRRPADVASSAPATRRASRWPGAPCAPRHHRPEEHLPRRSPDRRGPAGGGRDHPRRLALRPLRAGPRAARPRPRRRPPPGRGPLPPRGSPRGLRPRRPAGRPQGPRRLLRGPANVIGTATSWWLVGSVQEPTVAAAPADATAAARSLPMATGWTRPRVGPCPPGLIGSPPERSPRGWGNAGPPRNRWPPPGRSRGASSPDEGQEHYRLRRKH